MRINGEQPYTECAAVAFDRVWVNEAEEIAADKNGNDLRRDRWNSLPYAKHDSRRIRRRIQACIFLF